MGISIITFFRKHYELSILYKASLWDFQLLEELYGIERSKSSKTISQLPLRFLLKRVKQSSRQKRRTKKINSQTWFLSSFRIPETYQLLSTRTLHRWPKFLNISQLISAIDLVSFRKTTNRWLQLLTKTKRSTQNKRWFIILSQKKWIS